MPNELGLQSQNPYVAALGPPDVWTFSFSWTQNVPADTGPADQIADVMGEIRQEFERRHDKAAPNGGRFPDRLPSEWTPQAFVDRLDRVLRSPSLCDAAGRHYTKSAPDPACWEDPSSIRDNANNCTG